MSPAGVRRHALQLVEAVRALPYVWPGDRQAAAAREARAGTCASKHALLAECLATCGLPSAPLLVLGRLVPEQLLSDAVFASAAGLVEVHECLRVETPWAGDLVVDVTWDPCLLGHGFPGHCPWSGAVDMPFAIAATATPWSVDRAVLRSTKETLRQQLYSPAQRKLRGQVLERLSARFAEWRQAASPRAALP